MWKVFLLVLAFICDPAVTFADYGGPYPFGKWVCSRDGWGRTIQIKVGHGKGYHCAVVEKTEAGELSLFRGVGAPYECEKFSKEFISDLRQKENYSCLGLRHWESVKVFK